MARRRVYAPVCIQPARLDLSLSSGLLVLAFCVCWSLDNVFVSLASLEAV